MRRSYFRAADKYKGSALTQQLAKDHGRPFLHIDLATTPIQGAADRVAHWLGGLPCLHCRHCLILNVAGPSRSVDPDIYDLARTVLTELLLTAGYGSPRYR